MELLGVFSVPFDGALRSAVPIGKVLLELFKQRWQGGHRRGWLLHFPLSQEREQPGKQTELSILAYCGSVWASFTSTTFFKVTVNVILADGFAPKAVVIEPSVELTDVFEPSCTCQFRVSLLAEPASKRLHNFLERPVQEPFPLGGSLHIEFQHRRFSFCSDVTQLSTETPVIMQSRSATNSRDSAIFA
jgi:hypothetical protein